MCVVVFMFYALLGVPAAQGGELRTLSAFFSQEFPEKLYSSNFFFIIIVLF